MAASVALVGFGGALPARAEDVSPGRAGELDHMLRHDCGSCHGMTMRGGLGSALVPERLVGIPDAALVTIIMDGLPGTPMPPWRGLLTEGEAAWMVTHLRKGVAR